MIRWVRYGTCVTVCVCMGKGICMHVHLCVCMFVCVCVWRETEGVIVIRLERTSRLAILLYHLIYRSMRKQDTLSCMT